MGLTDITTAGQSGPGSNGNEGESRVPELEPHHQMQLCYTKDTHFFSRVKVLPICRRYNQGILNLDDNAT